MPENYIRDENFKILKEENLVHDQKFHKIVLNKMKSQAVLWFAEF